MRNVSKRMGKKGSLTIPQHLRHELGHVVQQKRGIVRPNYRLGG